MKKKIAQVILSIEGGAITCLVSDEPVAVMVFDWDNIKEGGIKPNDLEWVEPCEVNGNGFKKVLAAEVKRARKYKSPEAEGQRA